MDNTILKYLSVENFASFADKIEFTTEIDSGKKEFIEASFHVVIISLIKCLSYMAQMDQERLSFVK